MSYTKTIWANNDIVTTALLNKMETGIKEASDDFVNGLVIHDTVEEDLNGNFTIILDKTFSEIQTVIENGKEVWWKVSDDALNLWYIPSGSINYIPITIIGQYSDSIAFIECDRIFEEDENDGLLKYTISQNSGID